MLGVSREAVVPEQDASGQVLGASRAPKTSDESKALLWMLVMGASGMGAAAIMIQKRKADKEKKES